MDYKDGTIFDSDPTACQINYANPLMTIKCYTTTAGRGANISTNQQTLKQVNKKGNVNAMKTSAIAGQGGNYFGELNNLSDQIQRAAGMSYCNQSIERNFLGLSGGKESLNQFEDTDEQSALNNFDLLSTAPTPNTFNTSSTCYQSPQPMAETSPSKRKSGRCAFRKLEVEAWGTGPVGQNSSGRPAEKKLSDVFKQTQSFDPEVFLSRKRDRLQLGSKSEFPTL